MRGGERPGVVQRDRVRIKKARLGADELEFATGQLFAALVRKAFDERVRAYHHFREIKTNVFSTDAPRLGMAGVVQDFGSVEQRLRGHAAAQDAQPAHFRAAFDHGRPQTRPGRRPRCRVTGASPAEDGDIEVELVQPPRHALFRAGCEIAPRGRRGLYGGVIPVQFWLKQN